MQSRPYFSSSNILQHIVTLLLFEYGWAELTKWATSPPLPLTPLSSKNCEGHWKSKKAFGLDDMQLKYTKTVSSLVSERLTVCKSFSCYTKSKLFKLLTFPYPSSKKNFLWRNLIFYAVTSSLQRTVLWICSLEMFPYCWLK